MNDADLMRAGAAEAAELHSASKRILLYLDGIQLQYTRRKGGRDVGVGLRSDVLTPAQRLANIKIEETATAYRFRVPNPGQLLDYSKNWQISIDGGVTKVDAQFVDAPPNPLVPDEVFVTVQVV